MRSQRIPLDGLDTRDVYGLIQSYTVYGLGVAGGECEVYLSYIQKFPKSTFVDAYPRRCTLREN